jgi:23S rRNA (uracil1939-C5)-methyltransferase
MTKVRGAAGLKPGQDVSLTIEKPAAGGRMIARHEGQVVLVSGAIPGEHVLARVERVDRRVVLASVVDVIEAASDRRPAYADPLCGGCVYSHIAYPRQLLLKAAIVEDAFARIGKVPIERAVDVAGSPERAYRMRARFHVSGGRLGFYREGTHTLCDAAPTGQLSEDAVNAVRLAVERIEQTGVRALSVELIENVPGDQRAVSVDVAGDANDEGVHAALNEIVASATVTGCGVADSRGNRIGVGEMRVSDSLATLTAGRVPVGVLARNPDSFFQANRYLIGALVTAVLDAVAPQGAVLDLYAGVGLFSVVLAASGRGEITAVEGDRASAADLERNAGPLAGSLTLALESVEAYLMETRVSPETVIVDPPRTGVSSEALDRIIRLSAPRVVYVSCDPATMARDARKLIDAGYSLASLRGFDLFPATPHVEALGVFVMGETRS